jgi:hypothetical protein
LDRREQMPEKKRKAGYGWYIVLAIWAAVLVGVFVLRTDPAGVVAMQSAPGGNVESGLAPRAAAARPQATAVNKQGGPVGNTATPSATPCNTGAIVNGGFETGSFPPWAVQDINPVPVVTSTNHFEGTYSAFMGTLSGTEPTGDSSIYQTFTVPLTGGTLSYWWYGGTTDNISFDWQDAYILDANGILLATVMHECTNTNGWVHQTFDVTPFAGLFVQVKFLVHQDGFGDDTFMYLDNVILDACAATPTPVPTCPVNWGVVYSPDPDGPNGNRLVDVAAASANDVWAAGTSTDYNDPNPSPDLLVEHWDGSAWSIMRPPQTFGTSVGGVAALPNDVWIAGDYDGPVGVSRHQPLLLHWNGSTFSIAASPLITVPVGGIRDVAMVASNNVWVVGSYLFGGNTTQSLALHWSGTGWGQVPMPTLANRNSLQGLAVVSANDIWAVGEVDTSTPLFMHWDGTSWTRFNNPAAVSGVLYRTSAVSANDIWAVGYLTDGSGLPLTMHYDGTSWSVVTTPLPCCNHELTDVEAIASNDVWAVSENSFIHWDGASWNVVQGAAPQPSFTNFLQGIGAVSATDVWAVGNQYVDLGGSYDGTLAEHYSDACLPPTSTPVPSATVTPTAVATNYVVIPATGTIVPGTSDMGNHCNDCVTTITLPFAATLYDQQFSTALIGSNGTIGFVGNGNPPENTCVPSPAANFAIYAYWDDLGTGCGGCGIFTSVSGTAPSRIFNIEWRALRISNGASVHFEARLYEGDGRFDLIYGNVDSEGSASIGVQRDSGSLFTRVECEIAGGPNESGKGSPDGWIIADGATYQFGGPPECPLQFTDVPVGSTFYPYIHCLACRGIINGYPDGSFKPNNNVTRGQLSKIVANSAGFTDPQTVQLFEDVPLGSTFQTYIGRLATRGYINGYPCGNPEPCVPPGNLPYFRPNANATRGQISKIVSNAAGFSDPPAGQTFEDVAPGSTFYDFIERLATRGVMSGYPCGGALEPCVPPENRPYFRPNNNATRGQTSKIVGNTFFTDCEAP